MDLINLSQYSFFAGLLGLLFATGVYFLVKKYPRGNKSMVEIADAIHSGAMIFLRREYTFIIIFVAVVFLVL